VLSLTEIESQIDGDIVTGTRIGVEPTFFDQRIRSIVLLEYVQSVAISHGVVQVPRFQSGGLFANFIIIPSAIIHHQFGGIDTNPVISIGQIGDHRRRRILIHRPRH